MSVNQFCKSEKHKYTEMLTTNKVISMAVTLETLHREMKHMRNELHLLRFIIEDEYELSDEARHELNAARERMEKGEYVPHEEVMKKYG